MKLPESPEERAHTVKFALCAGIEPSLHGAFEQRFRFPVVEMWAMSETGRMLTDHEEPRQIHTRAVGRSVPGLEARAVAPNGNDVPLGEPGELVIRHNAATPRKFLFRLPQGPAGHRAGMAQWLVPQRRCSHAR
jgi:acyl-coenzyme A synthetase/AMP-(fatty) acid ligase